MKERRFITVQIKDSHLDALEDWLFCELTKEETRKVKKVIQELWILLVDADQKKYAPYVLEEFSDPQSDYNKEVRRNKKLGKKPRAYELAYPLHQLEIGETHLIKKSKWVSRKSPSEKLRRILKRTKKHFEISRKKDGTGWIVKRSW